MDPKIPNFPPPPYTPTAPVQTETTSLVIKPRFGYDLLWCDSCRRNTECKVGYHMDSENWVMFVLLIVVFFPLCWLPFVI